MNLWGEDLIIENSQNKSKKLLDKVNNVKTIKKTGRLSKNVSLEDRLILIKEEVEKVLGKYKDTTTVIKSKDEFNNYIDTCTSNGILALDTETNNSLDPLTCNLMGLCLYTPNEDSIYVPVNHRDRQTLEKFSWQLTEADIKEGLDKVKENNVKIITHNGKFDYEVIKCTCNHEFNIYWDSQIAAKVLDENELSAKLKDQYTYKIDPSEARYSIENLFDKLDYSIIDIDLFALYSATDAYKTYKLYEYQLKELHKPENKGLLNLLEKVEFPVIPVVAEMELTGVCIDLDYANRLKIKYDKKLENIQNKLDEELLNYSDKIEEWRTTEAANFHPVKSTGTGFGKSKSEQLGNPINLASPTQLAILLYDVLKVPVVDNKKPRGTGEDILVKIDIPLTRLILEYRGLLKLINTYINKLPECISKKDNRLHANFNQYGAKTGRFSSSDPNLQNIPSHENSIRMLFTASPGYIMVGSDYSQQEPRLLAHYSGDNNMISAYKEGRDLYATIASKVYNNNYEDNLEFRSDGSMNPDGKKRRSSCKTLLLGIMYGMEIPAIAESLNCSVKEASDIKLSFFTQFPKVKNWIEETQIYAKTYGYVEDIWGRRRRLPDIQRPKYEIKSKSKVSTFNPLIGSSGIDQILDESVVNKYLMELNRCKNRTEFNSIKERAVKDNITIYNNSGFISQAERQCVNARIQGGAASMSKLAMINVYNNEELRSLGFRLLIAVHDELIGECPKENKERCKELLSSIMINSAKPEVVVPMKCDADDFTAWYEDVYGSELKKEYEDYLKSTNDKEKSFNLLKENHLEVSESFLHNLHLA